MQFLDKISAKSWMIIGLFVGGLTIFSAMMYAKYYSSINTLSQDNQNLTAVLDAANPTDDQVENKAQINSQTSANPQKEDKPETTQNNNNSPAVAPDAEQIKFTKGGGGVSGDSVNVSLSTAEPQTGICIYNFSLDGAILVESNSIADSRTCSIVLPRSKFPGVGDWQLTLDFKSNDGMTVGTGGEITVAISPRSIPFVKGGGSQNGELVVISGTMAEAQTGTCTYQFFLNGTQRVKTTTIIQNSRTCSAKIPVSEFPGPATYNFKLSFTSRDGLVIASQANYDIAVK